MSQERVRTRQGTSRTNDQEEIPDWKVRMEQWKSEGEMLGLTGKDLLDYVSQSRKEEEEKEERRRKEEEEKEERRRKEEKEDT